MIIDPGDNRSATVRVLVIEDDRDYFATINTLLSGINRTEYVIRWVPDYLFALDELRAGRHDVCLLSYRFGDFDGPSILAYSHEHHLATPIIVLTSPDVDRDEADALPIGPSDQLCRDEVGAEALERAIRFAVYRNRAQKERRQHLAALDAVMDGLAIVDQSGYITSANRSMAAMYLFEEPAQLEGVDISAFFAGEYSRKLARSALAEAGRSGRWSGEAKGVRRSGETFSKEFAISTLGDGQFVLVERDTSESQDLKEQLFQSQRVEGIGQLTGGIVHDFNNLLSAVLGYSQLGLLKLPEHHPLRAYFEEIEKAAERAALLTRQVLSFNNGEAGQTQTVIVNHAIADLEMMLSRVIPENVDMVTDLADDLGCVSMNRGQLEQIILNLAINAADAMRSGGRLTLKTRNVTVGRDASEQSHGLMPGDYVYLGVSDTGEGMSNKVMARIFEPFFTTKDSDKGTGLGLSNCQGIITRSGGAISVDSDPGKGSTFNVFLPRTTSPGLGQRPESYSNGAHAMPSGKGTILLVEDEPSVRAVASRTLTHQGYDVIEACNGQEALDMARSMRPRTIHMLITDVVMPVLGGRELADEFEALHPDAKVLYVSGYTDDGTLSFGGLGPDAPFMRKPFSPVDLARKVSELLTGRRYGVSA